MLLTSFLRAVDMTMLELHNAKERDADDWNQLFHLADERLKIVSIVQPERSKLGLVEAVWNGPAYGSIQPSLERSDAE